MAEPAFAIAELVKLVVALGVTIGLFYALALFMKRMQVGTGKSGSLITVLAALPLGGKEKIWVVEVAGEKLVIGTTPGNVNCLHVLKHDAVPNSEALTASPTSFPRMPESSAVESEGITTPGPRMREGDDGSRDVRFAELLTKFRSWQK